ncbi:dual specificity protein kinase pyk3 [Hydra vulgaris]|uniref:Dual specificity protein kinase pyk3 n=1 Tax=Hydra vulgaris TaxID=6087 RepID=A0ABM4BIN8_HYDVU
MFLILYFATAILVNAHPIEDGGLPHSRDFYAGYIKALTDNFDQLFVANSRDARSTDKNEENDKADENPVRRTVKLQAETPKDIQHYKETQPDTVKEMKRSVVTSHVKEKRDAKDDGVEQNTEENDNKEDFESDENVEKKDNIEEQGEENKIEENNDFDNQEGREEEPDEEQDFDSVEVANKRQYILEHSDLKNLPYMPSIVSGFQDTRYSPLMGLGGFGNDFFKPFPMPTSFGNGLPYGVAYAIPIPILVSQDNSALKGDLRSKIRNKHTRRTVLSPPFLVSTSCNNPCLSSFQCGTNTINGHPPCSSVKDVGLYTGCLNNINSCNNLNRISSGYSLNTISANGANGNYEPCNSILGDDDNFQNLPTRVPVQIKTSADHALTNDCTNEIENLNCGPVNTLVNDGNTKNVNVHHIHHINHHHHHHIHQATPLLNPQRVGLNTYPVNGENYLNDDIRNDCLAGPTIGSNRINCNNPCTNVVMVPSGCGVKTI